MKIFKTISLMIIAISLLTGCSVNDDRLIALEDRIVQLENNEEKNLKVIANLSSVEESLNEIQVDLEQIKLGKERDNLTEDIKSLKLTFSKLESKVAFLKHILFGESIFDRDEIEVGYMVADMTLVDSTNTNENSWLAFSFEGEKTVTGFYQIINDEDWYDTVNFTVDNNTPDVLPREINDQRTLWFNFENYDEAVEMLSGYGSSGRLTIVIDTYTIKLLEGCVVNSAHLIRVESE